MIITQRLAQFKSFFRLHRFILTEIAIMTQVLQNNRSAECPTRHLFSR